jgi:hypothetical protein
MIKIKLPVVIAFQDYHEIPFFEDKLRCIIPGIKVREIGTRAPVYEAVVYVGKKSAPAVQRLIKKTTKRWEEENDG